MSIASYTEQTQSAERRWATGLATAAAVVLVATFVTPWALIADAVLIALAAWRLRRTFERTYRTVLWGALVVAALSLAVLVIVGAAVALTTD